MRAVTTHAVGLAVVEAPAAGAEDDCERLVIFLEEDVLLFAEKKRK